jgi:hypothetical protein
MQRGNADSGSADAKAYVLEYYTTYGLESIARSMPVK